MDSKKPIIMTADERAALVARCRAAALGIGWKFPFFLPSLARIEFRPDPTINPPTACVNILGIIRIHPAFAASLKTAELQFVIAHELMHLMLLHLDRRGSRDPLRWNIAGDLIINYTLQEAATLAAKSGSIDGIWAMPKVGIIATEDQAKLTTEQLYEDVAPTEAQQQAFADGMMPVGQGCGMDDTQGDVNANDPEGATLSDATLRRRWQEVAIQAQAHGRSVGNMANNILANMLDVPPAKVRWAQVLRGQLTRALAAAGMNDVSWQRRSRRSSKYIILPGGVTTHCRAVVSIDSSGSMSDETLAQCVAETTAIVNNLRVPVFLVIHDIEVQAAVWLRPGSMEKVHLAVKAEMRGRGGTDFDAAYERIAAEPGTFNVFVHLTDGGVGAWPAKPANVKRFVVALIGDAYRDGVPHDARTIEVDLQGK